jgi:hypothetical protein
MYTRIPKEDRDGKFVLLAAANYIKLTWSEYDKLIDLGEAAGEAYNNFMGLKDEQAKKLSILDEAVEITQTAVTEFLKSKSPKQDG